MAPQTVKQTQGIRPPAPIDATTQKKQAKPKKKHKHFDFIHHKKKVAPVKEAQTEPQQQREQQEQTQPKPIASSPNNAQIAQDLEQLEPSAPKPQEKPTPQLEASPSESEQKQSKQTTDNQPAVPDLKTNTDPSVHSMKPKEAEETAEEVDEHIHSLLENLQGGDLDSIADSMLETGSVGDEELHAEPLQSTNEPAEIPTATEINSEKRRNLTPSDDTARPPIASKSDKVIAPPSESEKPEHIEEADQEATKAIEGPMTNEAMPTAVSSAQASAKLEAIKNDGGSPHSGNMHDSENYQLPIKATKHHRKNDFVVWFFYTIASLSALSIAVLLVMALIS